MPFELGQSGNPAGKARGTRNKVTLAIEALLDGEAEALTRACAARHQISMPAFPYNIYIYSARAPARICALISQPPVFAC